ncbi:MAG: PSP1 domain-containing protein [Longimicrobiaceae bacterium]
MQQALPVLQPLAGAKEPRVVEVSFKGTRRDYYNCEGELPAPGEYVMVEVERGLDIGRVFSVGGVAKKKCAGCQPDANGDGVPARRVLRTASEEEVRTLHALRADEERIRRNSRELVERHGLKMKVSEAEWQWDRNKLTIYFTADQRVDFRALVRDLARNFRTRIELRQIGVRDEAGMLGGLGKCGRELCCSTWLRDIRPISLRLAKDQNLSLNPSQLSGVCGRLLCCLTYEHDSYLRAKRRFPREGRTLATARGREKVVGIDIWRDLVTLLDGEGERRTVGLNELKRETAAAR